MVNTVLALLFCQKERFCLLLQWWLNNAKRKGLVIDVFVRCERSFPRL